MMLPTHYTSALINTPLLLDPLTNAYLCAEKMTELQLCISWNRDIFSNYSFTSVKIDLFLGRKSENNKKNENNFKIICMIHSLETGRMAPILKCQF